MATRAHLLYVNDLSYTHTHTHTHLPEVPFKPLLDKLGSEAPLRGHMLHHRGHFEFKGFNRIQEPLWCVQVLTVQVELLVTSDVTAGVASCRRCGSGYCMDSSEMTCCIVGVSLTPS